MMVLQALFQKLMAQKLAGKGVCIDATHGTAGYDFPLTTVMVMDEQGEGFPIAWCLSNHEDFTRMCIFFQIFEAELWYLVASVVNVRFGKPVL